MILSCPPQPLPLLHLPFLEQHFDELGVKAVAAFMGNELTGQIATGEGEVAEQVKGLMPDAFVLEAELVIEHALRAEHQQILVGHPLPEPALAEPVGFFLEDESAGGSELLAEAGGSDGDFNGLLADGVVLAVIEFVLEREPS